MRTTVELDVDTAAGVEALRREKHVGVSEAVDELIRRGLAARAPEKAFRQRTRSLGMRIDVSNFAEALETLDGA
jgi:Ribbon-helix-helix protein, copG family